MATLDETDLTNIAAVIARLGALEVTVTSPVAVSGLITIYRGDDYSAAEARSLAFEIADPNHLYRLDEPGAEAHLDLEQATWQATKIQSTPEGYTVLFEPTQEQTAALTCSQLYELELKTGAGRTVTVATGKVTVKADIPVLSS